MMIYKDGCPCVSTSERFSSAPDFLYCVKTEVSRSRFLEFVYSINLERLYKTPYFSVLNQIVTQCGGSIW